MTGLESRLVTSNPRIVCRTCNLSQILTSMFLFLFFICHLASMYNVLARDAQEESL